tara:strand:+ start:748 stop:1662 length:915 start_codon:yes stop_codon:yes gene_type:complete
MAKTQKTKGNPAPIGMQGDNIQNVSKQSKNAGSKEFFDALDNQVNGSIVDTEATLSSNTSKQDVSTNQGSNKVVNSPRVQKGGTDWEKRYKDSSREAVKWREQYKQVEKFVPVLEAMKEDSGLVEHVREYLVNGGSPAKSIQEKLNLGEDFIFDQQEAMTDPDSDSAKLMNAHVDGLVQQRINAMTDAEKKKSAEMQKAKAMKDQEIEFRKKNNMSEDEFLAFKEKAKKHRMTLDDVHYILNKEKTAANVAQSTKKDMMNQMKNVRSIPTSASGANSQGGQKSADREVFDQIVDFGDGVDNLFG